MNPPTAPPIHLPQWGLEAGALRFPGAGNDFPGAGNDPAFQFPGVGNGYGPYFVLANPGNGAGGHSSHFIFPPPYIVMEPPPPYSPPMHSLRSNDHGMRNVKPISRPISAPPAPPSKDKSQPRASSPAIIETAPKRSMLGLVPLEPSGESEMAPPLPRKSVKICEPQDELKLDRVEFNQLLVGPTEPQADATLNLEPFQSERSRNEEYVQPDTNNNMESQDQTSHDLDYRQAGNQGAHWCGASYFHSRFPAGVGPDSEPVAPSPRPHQHQTDSSLLIAPIPKPRKPRQLLKEETQPMSEPMASEPQTLKDEPFEANNESIESHESSEEISKPEYQDEDKIEIYTQPSTDSTVSLEGLSEAIHGPEAEDPPEKPARTFETLNALSSLSSLPISNTTHHSLYPSLDDLPLIHRYQPLKPVENKTVTQTGPKRPTRPPPPVPQALARPASTRWSMLQEKRAMWSSQPNLAPMGKGDTDMQGLQAGSSVTLRPGQGYRTTTGYQVPGYEANGLILPSLPNGHDQKPKKKNFVKRIFKTNKDDCNPKFNQKFYV